MLTLSDRVAAYARSAEGKRFPDSIPAVSPSGRWLLGTWQMGQDYRAPSKLYGAYPPRYLNRVMALFPDVAVHEVLHVFAGCVPACFDRQNGQFGRWLRIDRSFDRDPAPSLYADLAALPFSDGSLPHKLVMADPPYSGADAVKYGTAMPNRKAVLHELHRVCAPGTHLAWLDTVLPMYRKAEWRHYGNLTIIRSTNHRFRVATLFERV